MKSRPTLAAVIIAQNEAANLAELLPRLDWVDQIVVVDGGSRDATVTVAQQAGATVGVHPFDTFARQRNRALALATTDWVLAIDADERPAPRLAAEIRGRIAHSRAAAYRVPIRSTIFGRPLRRCGTQDDRPLRLMRRSAGCWERDVHEIVRIHGPIGCLTHWLEHRTLPDLAAFLVKMERYTSLEAAARVERGVVPRWHEAWIAPLREFVRRLLWKQGLLDGPAGWAFCLLSGVSAWVVARKHQQLWTERQEALSPMTDEAWRELGVAPWQAESVPQGDACCEAPVG